MDLTNAILNYRRFIKRKNYSAYTVKNYMSTLRQFISWIDTPVESVSNKKLLCYIDHLQRRRLAPKTINSHLAPMATLKSPTRGRVKIPQRQVFKM